MYKSLNIFKVLVLAPLTVLQISTNNCMDTTSERILNYTASLESSFQSQLFGSERSICMKSIVSCPEVVGGKRGSEWRVPLEVASASPVVHGRRPRKKPPGPATPRPAAPRLPPANPPPGPLGSRQNFGAEKNFCSRGPNPQSAGVQDPFSQVHEERRRVKRRWHAQRRAKERKLSLEMAYNLTVPRNFLKRIIGKTRGKLEKKKSPHKDPLKLKIRVLGSGHKRRRHRKKRPYRTERPALAGQSFIILPSGMDTVTVRIPSLNLSFLLEGPTWKALDPNSSGEKANNTLVLTRKGDETASKVVGGRLRSDKPSRKLPLLPENSLWSSRLASGARYKPGTIGAQLMSHIMKYLKTSTSPTGSRKSVAGQTATVSGTAVKLKAEASTTTKVRKINKEDVSTEALTTDVKTGLNKCSNAHSSLSTINISQPTASNIGAKARLGVANMRSIVNITELVRVSTDSIKTTMESAREQSRDHSTEINGTETHPKTISTMKLSLVSPACSSCTTTEESKTLPMGTITVRTESIPIIAKAKTISVKANSTMESRTVKIESSTSLGSRQGEEDKSSSTMEPKLVLTGPSTTTVLPKLSPTLCSTLIDPLPIRNGSRSDLTRSTRMTTTSSLDMAQSRPVKDGVIPSKSSPTEQAIIAAASRPTIPESTQVTTEIRPGTTESRPIAPESKSVSLTEPVSTTGSGVVTTNSVAGIRAPTISSEDNASTIDTPEKAIKMTETTTTPISTESLTVIPEVLLPHLFPFLTGKEAETSTNSKEEGSPSSTTFRSSFLAMIGPFDPMSSLRLSDILSSAARSHAPIKKNSTTLFPKVSIFKRSCSKPKCPSGAFILMPKDMPTSSENEGRLG